MLSHFRSRYLMGSIVTDLVRVEEGIYIVKAQVAVNDTVLGCGLAGSTTVEEAEDAAIQRALRIAGMDNASAQIGTAIPLNSVPNLSPLPLAPVSNSQGPGPAPAQNFNQVSSSQLSSVSSPNSPALELEDLRTSPEVETKSAPAKSASSTPISPTSATPTPAPPSKPVSSTPTLSSQALLEHSPEDVPAFDPPELEDLSELIAQTDVELTRIGWGPKEGRRFLKEEFHKQSRQQLDSDELREFLQHLKQQPTRLTK